MTYNVLSAAEGRHARRGDGGRIRSLADEEAAHPSYPSVACYKQTFMQLLRYWKLRFPDQLDPDLGQFQVAPLLDFLSYLEKTLGNTVSTRNTRLAALKSFFKMVGLLQPRYQDQCRQILALPSKRIRRRRKPDFLEKHEVDAVFASVDTQTRDGYRDLCILRTLYNTGARASELCALLIPNLDWACVIEVGHV